MKIDNFNSLFIGRWNNGKRKRKEVLILSYYSDNMMDLLDFIKIILYVLAWWQGVYPEKCFLKESFFKRSLYTLVVDNLIYIQKKIFLKHPICIKGGRRINCVNYHQITPSKILFGKIYYSGLINWSTEYGKFFCEFDAFCEFSVNFEFLFLITWDWLVCIQFNWCFKI